jgi:succinylglutamate desuccinylase
MASEETSRPPAAVAGGGERILIDYTTGKPGPCLVGVAGLHGDELGGVRALERVRKALEHHRPRARGRFIAVLGNLPAIAAARRYFHDDLNRNWFEEDVAALLSRDPAGDSTEDAERRELLAVLDSLESAPEHPVVFADLHSTSAEGLPFSCMPDTLINLRIGLQLPFPAILGLEDTIRGPLMGILSDRGYACVIVEGGAHENPRTTDILEATTWVLMARLGILAPGDIPAYGEYWSRLTRAGRGLPQVLEVCYQHETHDGDGFVMEPGFRHYDRVRKGQLIARDRSGEIRSHTDGRIIMPAYKPGTDQGFFIARDVAWWKIRLLFLLRTLRLGHVVHLLPGARVRTDDRNIMDVSHWVPERLVQIIRLLGWRRTHRDSTGTILRRRRVRGKPRIVKDN